MDEWPMPFEVEASPSPEPRHKVIAIGAVNKETESSTLYDLSSATSEPDSQSDDHTDLYNATPPRRGGVSLKEPSNAQQVPYSPSPAAKVQFNSVARGIQQQDAPTVPNMNSYIPLSILPHATVTQEENPTIGPTKDDLQFFVDHLVLVSSGARSVTGQSAQLTCSDISFK